MRHVSWLLKLLLILCIVPFFQLQASASTPPELDVRVFGTGSSLSPTFSRSAPLRGAWHDQVFSAGETRVWIAPYSTSNTWTVTQDNGTPQPYITSSIELELSPGSYVIQLTSSNGSLTVRAQHRFTVTPSGSTGTSIFFDFESPTSLTDNFTSSTDGSGTQFSWNEVGLNDGGGVEIPLGSDHIWTTKSAYTVTAQGTYVLSGYFKNAGNAGHGAIGFSTESINSASGSIAMPGTGSFIGVSYHGGGGNWINNSSGDALIWTGGDMTSSPATWYFFELTLEARGGSTYDITFEIYNTDSTGTIGSLKTTHTATAVPNAGIASAPQMYAFFSGNGSRTGAIDNLKVQLSGAEIVPNAPTPLTLQAHGGVVQFDGTSYITTTETSLNGTEDFTLEAWFHLSQLGDWQGIAGKNDTTDDAFNTFIRISDGGQLQFVLGDGINANMVFAGEIIDTNAWHHVAGTYDSSTKEMALYLNGVLKDTGELIGATRVSNTHPIEIAVFKNNFFGEQSFPFHGMMDEVRVWSVARTPSEIQNNMHRQLLGDTTDLLAYYNFDERIGSEILDRSSNENHATLSSSLKRLNFLGDNLKFDGVDDFIMLGDVTHEVILDQASFAAWVRLDVEPVSDYYDLFKQEYAYAIAFSSPVGPNGSRKLHFNMHDGISWGGGVESVQSVSIGQWHHVAVIYDSNELQQVKLYIDGVLDSAHTRPKPLLRGNTNPLLLGSTLLEGGGNNGYFNGAIAEASLWNVALDSTEISVLMHGTPTNPSVTTSLLGYWPLNEGSGVAAKDRSAAANHGTIQSATWQGSAPPIAGSNVWMPVMPVGEEVPAWYPIMGGTAPYTYTYPFGQSPVWDFDPNLGLLLHNGEPSEVTITDSQGQVLTIFTFPSGAFPLQVN